MPILDSHKKDIFIFYIPGILSLIILNLFSEGIIFDWGLLIVAYYFADAGHVYTTVLRYKFDSPEKVKEVTYPFILFTVTIFTAIAFDVKTFWSLLIYATFLHNLKQAYGISSWYNLRSGAKKNNFKMLFYSINCLSLLALHFRSDLVNVNSYPMLFIFRFPNPMLFKITFTLIGIGLVFLIWERLANGKGFHSRLYPIFMTGIYFYSFVVAETMHEILIPLLITHGLSYMALIQDSSKKVFSKNKILGIVLLSLMGGFLDWFFLDEKFLFNHSLFFHHFFRAMIFGAIFTHYYLDGKIWKKDHPHFELIFKDAATS